MRRSGREPGCSCVYASRQALTAVHLDGRGGTLSKHKRLNQGNDLSTEGVRLHLWCGRGGRGTLKRHENQQQKNINTGPLSNLMNILIECRG